MATAVPSRFACLKIEDDDVIPTLKGIDDAPNNIKKNVKNITVKKGDNKKNKAIGKPAQNSTPNGPSKKKKKQLQGGDQWEQWKQKDNQLVDGNFEDDLQQAILLSKLDYEEKKDLYGQLKKQADFEKKQVELVPKPGNKKQKKSKSMSLGQFNELVAGPEDQKKDDFYNGCSPSPEEEKVVLDDTAFFERIQSEAKVEIQKSRHTEILKQRKPVSDEQITREQFLNVIAKKDCEIAQLKDEINNLKQDLLKVRRRNKDLCSILGQGEMKDKAEILTELEELRTVQSELTNEVTSLHAQLEQERSKTCGGAKTDPKSKDKRKKPLTEKEKL